MTQALVPPRLAEEKRVRIAQGLSDAAALIRARGWCVGGMEDDSGRVCLMGAVREVFLHEATDLRYRAYDAVNLALRRQNRDIAAWNDQQQDPEIVAGLLETCATKIAANHERRQVCRHARPICPECKRPEGCSSDDHGTYDYRLDGHAPQCSRRPRRGGFP